MGYLDTMAVQKNQYFPIFPPAPPKRRSRSLNLVISQSRPDNLRSRLGLFGMRDFLLYWRRVLCHDPLGIYSHSKSLSGTLAVNVLCLILREIEIEILSEGRTFYSSILANHLKNHECKGNFIDRVRNRTAVNILFTY